MQKDDIYGRFVINLVEDVVGIDVYDKATDTIIQCFRKPSFNGTLFEAVSQVDLGLDNLSYSEDVLTHPNPNAFAEFAEKLDLVPII
jgi:hypothetical protein